MIRRSAFIFLFVLASTSFGQNFNFYKGETLLGEKMYGLEDENGLEVTDLKWRVYYKYETDQFGEPLGVVSEDGLNYYFINLRGERVSLFNFTETFYFEDTRMQYKGDMKITYHLYHKMSRSQGDYEYYLTKDCACDPRPYYPCPARFPMDTLNADEAIKNVQKMQFVLEFYTIDSALTMCNQLIEETPNEPQYYHYKAWLINRAFPISYARYRRLESEDEFPIYMWDELIRLRDKGLIGKDEKRLMFLAQYETIQAEIKRLENNENWFARNRKYAEKFILDYDDYGYISWFREMSDWDNEENYALRKISYHEAIEALSEVLKIEKEEETLLLTKAWQNEVLDDFYYEYGYDYTSDATAPMPYQSVYDRNEMELRKSPNLYKVLKQDKFGPIARINAASRNGELGFGVGLGMGLITRMNKLRTTEFSAGLGYNHYFLNDTFGEYYLDFTFGTVGWIEMRFSPSILTNYEGTRGLGFVPSIGLRVWDIYLSYGYHFARKSKFDALRGHSFGLSYGFSFIQDRQFLKKRDGFEL